MRISLNQKGLSLVEVTIWIMVSSILIAGLSVLYARTASSWSWGTNRYSLQQTANLLHIAMADRLRNAKNIESYTTNYANAGEAIRFESTRQSDTTTDANTQVTSYTTYVYYVDKTTRHVKYLRGTSTTPVEEIGQVVSKDAGSIQVQPLDVSTSIFSVNSTTNTVTIRFNLASTNTNQPAIPVKTVIHGLDDLYGSE